MSGASKADLEATDEVAAPGQLRLALVLVAGRYLTDVLQLMGHSPNLQEGDDGSDGRKKYQLRDRSQMPKEQRYSPPREEERDRLRCADQKCCAAL